MNSIPGFNHGTPARQGAVSAHERQLLAEVTRWSRIDLRSSLLPLGIAQASLALRSLTRSLEYRHFAGILLALDEGDDIVA